MTKQEFIDRFADEYQRMNPGCTRTKAIAEAEDVIQLTDISNPRNTPEYWCGIVMTCEWLDETDDEEQQ